MNNTEKPTIPLLDLPGSERLKANRERAAEQHLALAAKYRHLDWMVNQITAAVEAAPMAFIADGGERAHRLANRLHEQAQREELQRAQALLVTLEDAIKTIHNHATAETAHARMIGDAHAGDYNEGRAKGCSEVLTAVQAAKSALYGIGRGNTRQENAQAFAETIINQTGADQ